MTTRAHPARERPRMILAFRIARHIDRWRRRRFISNSNIGLRRRRLFCMPDSQSAERPRFHPYLVLEHQWNATEHDLLTRLEVCFRDPHAINKGPVSRAEIAQVRGSIGYDHLAMGS